MQTFMRILFVSLLCVSISARKKSTPKFRCDYTKVPEIDGWLKYQEIPANWYNARLRCHMEGAILASPLNANFSRAMRAMVKANYINTAVFTGIHATFSQGDYTSVDGMYGLRYMDPPGIFLSDIPHTWAIGEPDDYQDKESCLVLLPDGTLADKQCADPHPYLCYKKNEKMVFSSCGTTDPDYTLDTRTGSCYKFHTVPRTWSRAYMNCMAEGGYLTIINSETEAGVLRDLYAKYPANLIPGNFWKDVAFIGFNDWNEHADWRTIHGQTLQEAGYDKFSGGLPDNATTGEYCGSIFRTALLNDLWCNNYYVFICEKDPNSLANCYD